MNVSIIGKFRFASSFSFKKKKGDYNGTFLADCKLGKVEMEIEIKGHFFLSS